jgi:hypothetical protein
MENIRKLEREARSLVEDKRLNFRSLGMKLRCASIDVSHYTTMPEVPVPRTVRALTRALWWVVLLASKTGYSLDELAGMLWEDRFEP